MYSNDAIAHGPELDSVASPFRGSATRRPLFHRTSATVITVGCILLGLCLLSPSLWTGLVAGDHLREPVLRDESGLISLSQRAVDLARFADGRSEMPSASSHARVFPWAAPDAVLVYLRPLSSAVDRIDLRFWPANPLLMQLHSLLWFGLLLTLVAAAYRRFGAYRHGFSLALLLFAVDDAHAPIVGWIANRNALVALCLALPALLVHDRQRRSGFVHGVWLGPVLFLLGLIAGDVAISVFAYLVAYALCLDRGRWYARFGTLLPYVVTLGTWKLACIALGNAASGSGSYVDPLREPLAFARLACERLPVLGLDLLAGPFADFSKLYPVLSPSLRVGVLLLALFVLGVFALALRPLLRRDSSLHFWVTGTGLSLLPLCVTLPDDRLLLGPGIGAMAVIGALIELGWAERRSLLPALGVGVLATVHLIAAPLLAPLRAANVAQLVGETGTPFRVSTNKKEVPRAEVPISPRSTRPSLAGAVANPARI
jgi:hypothetical protein